MLDFNFSINHLVSILTIGVGFLYAFQIGSLKKVKTNEGKYFTYFLLVLTSIVFLFLILVFTAVLLFANLPDANEFNLKVERIFIESDIMPIGNEIRLLEVLANSGTAFSEVLSSYRYIIFTVA